MRTDTFLVMNTRKIIDILIGDVDFGKIDDVTIQMPYLRGPDLCSILTQFGRPTAYPMKGGALSRWQYMEILLIHASERGKESELLNFLFDKVNFHDRLKYIEDKEEKLTAYKKIVSEVISKINGELALSDKTLCQRAGRYYVVDEAQKNSIQYTALKVIDSKYIHDLKERIEIDLNQGFYDSVITKSRTLIEEVLVYIIDNKRIDAKCSGDILKMYRNVKDALNMNQNNNYDKRINSLLSGLEKVIQAITEWRNAQSDAHGVGEKRLNIRKHEAILVVNSAITFSEYIYSVFEHQKN